LELELIEPGEKSSSLAQETSHGRQKQRQWRTRSYQVVSLGSSQVTKEQNDGSFFLVP
jgi:hypothetical protein